MALLPWGVTLAVVAAVVAIGVLRQRLRRATERAERAERKARLLLARSERDQARLAKGLHDGPIQDLLALNMASSLVAHFGGDAAHDDAGHDLSDVIRQLRAVSEGIRPPALDAFGLAAAIGAHADRFQDLYPGIDVSLDLADDALAPGTRLALFRIVQEALHNAALHGPPVHVQVTLAVSEAGAALTIRDDGDGWDVPPDVTTLASAGQYGVFGMLAQAESVGAQLEVQSTPGETVIRVVAPPTPPNWT